MIFGSSLPPVVCRRAHVLFALFVFVCVYWCPTPIVLCFRFVCFRIVYVPYVASFSGLLLRYSLTSIHSVTLDYLKGIHV